MARLLCPMCDKRFTRLPTHLRQSHFNEKKTPKLSQEERNIRVDYFLREAKAHGEREKQDEQREAEEPRHEAPTSSMADQVKLQSETDRQMKRLYGDDPPAKTNAEIEQRHRHAMKEARKVLKLPATPSGKYARAAEALGQEAAGRKATSRSKGRTKPNHGLKGSGSRVPSMKVVNR